MKVEQYKQIEKLEDFIYKNKEYSYLNQYLDRFDFIKTDFLLDKIDYVRDYLKIDEKNILKSVYVSLEDRVYSYNLPGTMKLTKEIVSFTLNVSKNKAKRFRFIQGVFRFGTYTPIIPQNINIDSIIFVNLPDYEIHIALGDITFIDPYLSAYIHKNDLIEILYTRFSSKVKIFDEI